MNKLEVTFRVVTPMFLGGAKPNDFAELRPPSIKSAMRYWYRALDKQEFMKFGRFSEKFHVNLSI